MSHFTDNHTVIGVDVFTTGQVAHLLGVAPRSVSKWCDNGRMTCYRLPGSKDRRILRTELIVFCHRERLPVPVWLGKQIILAGVPKDVCECVPVPSIGSKVTVSSLLEVGLSLDVEAGEHAIVFVVGPFARSDVLHAGDLLRQVVPYAKLHVIVTDDETNGEEFRSHGFDEIVCPQSVNEIPELLSELQESTVT